MKPNHTNSNVQPVSLVRHVLDRSDYPALDRVAEKLAAALAQHFMEQDVDCTEARRVSTTVSTFDTWRRQPALDSVSVKIRMTPFKSSVLMTFPVSLIILVVDRAFGGTAPINATRTELSQTEQRTFHRLCCRVADLLKQSWAGTAAIDPAISAVEPTTDTQTLVAGTHQVIVQVLQITLEQDKDFAISIVTPLAFVRSLPELEADPGAEERSSFDPAWAARLSEAVMQIHMPVRTIFARPEVSLAKLLSLHSGDVIPVCIPDHLPVTVAGQHVADAKMGETNGRAAVQIERIEHGFSAHE
jgi:flagellar motor switch protein FliM